MLRRANTYLLTLGLAFVASPFINEQTVFAQAQSASTFTRPVTVNVNPANPVPTGPTIQHNHPAVQNQQPATGHSSSGSCSTCSSARQPLLLGGLPRLNLSTLGSGMNQMRSSFKSVVARARLDYNRNAAWPQPFLDADRAAYQGFIQPCIDRGWEIQNTLSDDCFDGRTGRLNRMGAAKIRDVVHAAPLSRKSVFVYSSGAKELVDARVKEVKSYLQYEFGRSNNVNVAVTKSFPHGGRGIYAENMVPKYYDALPKPALNGDSVSSAVSGGN